MLWPTFDELLLRADEVVLQELLGRPALRLLQSLLGRDLPVGRLRAVLLQLHTPLAMLTETSKRRLLLELLRLDEARALIVELDLRTPTAKTDPFAALQALPPRLNSAAFRRLLGSLGVDDEQEHPKPEPPPDRVDVTPAYGLFAHQRTAARETHAVLATGHRRVLLHMPTGAGKTRTAMHIVAEFLRSTEPVAVIWLATSEELCEQAAAEFERCWRHVGNREVAIHRCWGAHEFDRKTVRDGLVVAGLKKLYSAGNRDLPFLAELGDKAGLIVIDEAHQAIAESYRAVLETLIARNPDGSLLGLSATPGRTWNNPTEDRELSEFFGERKVALRVPGYTSPIRFLVAEGYLAQPVFRSLRHTQAGALTEDERKGLAAELDVPEAVLRRLAEDEVRNVAIVREIQDLSRRHRRVLVFGATVEHALLLATVLSALGLSAKSVSGSTPTADRSRIIAWYKDDAPEHRVLANFGVLTTGFDAPATSAAVIARPTKSLVLFSQMVGRATRGRRAGGNAEAEVVTVVDTALPGFGDLAEAFTNWEDVW
jgi:DNA repair protein RadD